MVKIIRVLPLSMVMMVIEFNVQKTEMEVMDGKGFQDIKTGDRPAVPAPITVGQSITIIIVVMGAVPIFTCHPHP